jgi:Phosphotransferase enzyme family
VTRYPDGGDRSAPAVELTGGTANRGLVVRIGDTVRRPQRRSSPSTARLLTHLERVGFDGAPRYLGIDESGREVLTFVEGHAVTHPYPGWALTDEALVSVALLLRRYHRAVAVFDPRGLPWPRPVPPPFTGSLVCHNDPNLDNVVFRDGVAVALIDFDLASPGAAVWDVANTARLWAPLRRDGDIDDDRRGQALPRLRLFADAYGVDRADRDRLVDAVPVVHGWSYDIVREGAAAGRRGYVDHWTPSVQARSAREQEWFVDNRDAMRAALAAP